MCFGVMVHPVMGEQVYGLDGFEFSSNDPQGLYTPVDFSHLPQLDEDGFFFDPVAEATLNNMLAASGHLDFDLIRQIEHNTLMFTLGEPLGVVGFYDYQLANPNEFVDITVEFVTPPYVALQLMSQRNMLPMALSDEGASYQVIAASAHHAFNRQLSEIAGLGRSGVFVLSEHTRLFNGVFLSVPAGMVEQIAALDEVFLVSPISTFETLSEQLPPWDANLVSDDFMREPLDVFDIDGIRQDLDVWGRGVRVAVMDTGIEYRHPVFQPFVTNENGIITGHDFVDNDNDPQEATWEAWNSMPNPPASPNAQGRYWWTTHGTHVSGSVVAIAPGIEMSHYRVLGPFGTGTGLATTSALEMIHAREYDLVNMSLGSTNRNVWAADVRQVNLMVMDGITIVVAAGNHVHLGEGSVLNPAIAPLAISVGAVHRGGLLHPWYNASVDGGARVTELEAHGWGPNHIFQENLAGIPNMNIAANGDVEYVYLGIGWSNAAHTEFGFNVDLDAIGGLEGRIAVFRRGAVTFGNMRVFANANNAAGMIIINHNTGQDGDIMRFSSSLSGIQAANLIPTFLTSHNQGQVFSGVGTLGTINFGAANHSQLPTTDHTTSFSSIGPVMPLFHIKPDIVAPGFMVHSTYPSFAIYPHNVWDDWANAYSHQSGTSMAAPIVAGLVALLMEQFPDATPLELKARLMNTAQHMPEVGNNTVYAVGAGFPDIRSALTQQAWAAVTHDVLGIGVPGDTQANPIPSPTGMASLSFGIFRQEITSRDLEVVIHNAGGAGWATSVTYLLPDLTGSISFPYAGVFNTSDNTYTITVRMSFTSECERGFHQGHIVFTNGAQRITMPFAGNLMGELVITPRASSGILRPILAASAVPAALQANGAGTASRTTPVIIGFNDSWGEHRVVDFFARRVDPYTMESYGTAIPLGSHNNMPANTDFHQAALLRTDTTVATGVRPIAQTQGLHRFYMHVRVDGQLWGDYFAVGEYIVTETVPTLTLDNADGIFEFAVGTPTVEISGKMDSWAHDLAVEHNIRTLAYEDAYGNPVVFGHTFMRYAFGAAQPSAANFNGRGFGASPAADGTFSFTVNTGAATIRNPIVLNGHARDAHIFTDMSLFGATLTTAAGALRTPNIQVRLTTPWPVLDELAWNDNQLTIYFDTDDNPPIDLLIAGDFSFEFFPTANPGNRAQVAHTTFANPAGTNYLTFAFDRLQADNAEGLGLAAQIAPLEDISITLVVIYRNEEYAITIGVDDNNYITIAPTAATVMQGNSQQFASDIFVLTNPNFSQDAIWSVVGNSSDGTSINQNGLLTVALDEIRQENRNGVYLYVVATSAYNSSLVATAAINVQHRPSTVSTLNSLSIPGRTLSPAFAPNVLNYTLTVPYETTSVMVNFTTTHYLATVEGAGLRNLDVGNNIITILVRAENGIATTTYTITVTRQALVVVPPMTPPITGDDFIIWDSFGGDRGNAPFLQPSNVVGTDASRTPSETFVNVMGLNESNTERSLAFMGDTSLRWEIDFSQIDSGYAHSVGLGVASTTPMPRIEGRNPTSIGMWIRAEGSNLNLNGLFAGLAANGQWSGFSHDNMPLVALEAATQASRYNITAYGDWQFVEFFLDTAADAAMNQYQQASTFMPQPQLLLPQADTFTTDASDTFIGINHGTAVGYGVYHVQNADRPNQPATIFIDGISFFFNYDEAGTPVFESTGLFSNITRPEMEIVQIGAYVHIIVNDGNFGINMDSLTLTMLGQELAGTSHVSIAGNVITINTSAFDIGIHNLRVEISNNLNFRTVYNFAASVGQFLPPIEGDNFIIWDTFGPEQGAAPFFQPSRLSGIPAAAISGNITHVTPAATGIAQMSVNYSNTEDSLAFMGDQVFQWDIDFSQTHPAAHSVGVGPGFSGQRIPQLAGRNPTSIGMWIRVEGDDLVDLYRMFVGVATLPAPTAVQILGNWRGFTLSNTVISHPMTLSEDDGWVFVEFFLSTAPNASILNSIASQTTFTVAQQAGPLYFPFMPAAAANNTFAVDSFFGFSHGVQPGQTIPTGQQQNPHRPTTPTSMFIGGITFFYNYDEAGAPVFASTGLFDNLSRPEIGFNQNGDYLSITLTGGSEHFALNMTSLGLSLNNQSILNEGFVSITGNVATINTAQMQDGDTIRVEVANNLRFRTVETFVLEAGLEPSNQAVLHGFDVLGVSATYNGSWNVQLPTQTNLAEIAVTDFTNIHISQFATHEVLVVDAGLGLWTITVTAQDNTTVTHHDVVLTVVENLQAPTITGPLFIALVEGYDTVFTEPFIITGNPQPTVVLESNYPQITWDAIENRLVIAPGLGIGFHNVSLRVDNGVLPTTSHRFAVIVTGEDGEVAPQIWGPLNMSLVIGYEAAFTQPFTVSGNPAPVVFLSDTHGGFITWNGAESRLDIAPGLEEGLYYVTLTADNGFGQPSTASFELSVVEQATPPWIVSSFFHEGMVGINYTAAIFTTGTGPFTWSIISGALPQGLYLNPVTGIISGVPTTSETAFFTIMASNPAGLHDTRELSITISIPAPAVVVVSPSLIYPGLTPGSQQQFSSFVLPLSAPQEVVWDVSGHAEATISYNGLLHIGADVPLGTILTITATAIGTNISGSTTINVVERPIIPTRLPAPTNLDVTGTMLAWDVVDYAVGYRIYVDDSPVGDVVTETAFDLASLNLGNGNFTIQVRAIGEGFNLNSLLSEYVIFIAYTPVVPQPLPAPTNLHIVASTLRWDAVASATGYRVYVNGTARAIATTTSINLATLQLAIGDHSIQLRTLSNGITNLDSVLSATINFTIQPPPPPQEPDDYEPEDYQHTPPTQQPTPQPPQQAPPTTQPEPEQQHQQEQEPQPQPAPELTTQAPIIEFVDVAPNHWAFSFIQSVAANNLFQGVGEGRFAPSYSMTRAMFVQVLANFEDVDLAEFQSTQANAANPTFADVHPAAWYFAAVEWAAGQGLVSGVGNGNFAPSDPITREQMVVLINLLLEARGVELATTETNAFVDHADISYWAVGAVNAIQAAGLITGHPDGRFAPRDTATRAEVAVVFSNLLEAIQ